MLRSGNPALRDDVFVSAGSSSRREPIGSAQDAITIQGTVNKTFVLLFLLLLTANWSWSNPYAAAKWIMPAIIVGLIVGFVTIFKREFAPVTAPLYALIEGVILGGISSFFEATYQGIVMQAVTLTFGVLFSLLLAYKSGLIRATENFKLGIVAATGGIMVLYLVDLIMGIWGRHVSFIYSNGPAGIIFSVIVVVIAALNLVMDFDFIEKGSEQGAPKYMEWYGAFGLMVTLIWLYLEILRLLAKSRRR